jgi:anion-transporting  ArsA/GET3 family ATPase
VFEHFVDAAPGLKELGVLGHALRVIRGIEPTPRGVPDLVILDAPATGHGVSMLAAPRVVSEVVDAGPFARLAGELAAFIADPQAVGIVLVTLAEEMPVHETLELRTALNARVGRDPDLLVVNAVYPPADQVRAGTTLPGAANLWRRRRDINDRELARLARHWSGDRLVVPLVPRDPGPPLVAELSARLARAFTGAGA